MPPSILMGAIFCFFFLTFSKKSAIIVAYETVAKETIYFERDLCQNL